MSSCQGGGVSFPPFFIPVKFLYFCRGYYLIFIPCIICHFFRAGSKTDFQLFLYYCWCGWSYCYNFRCNLYYSHCYSPFKGFRKTWLISAMAVQKINGRRFSVFLCSYCLKMNSIHVSENRKKLFTCDHCLINNKNPLRSL